MGKTRKQLSHAEIWDDSHLIQSWEDAVEEYRLYHSIHARGERVEDVIREMEADGEEIVPPANVSKELANGAQADSALSEDLEDGEVAEDDTDAMPTVNGHTEAKEDVNPSERIPEDSRPSIDKAANQPLPSAGLPNVLMNGVRDEALKNLMMSWYYAGYYTGLYEGQQPTQKAATR